MGSQPLRDDALIRKGFEPDRKVRTDLSVLREGGDVRPLLQRPAGAPGAQNFALVRTAKCLLRKGLQPSLPQTAP